MDFETMYNAKDAQPFDQKNEMFKRARWEEKFRWAGKRYYGMVEPKEKPGFRIMVVGVCICPGDRHEQLWHLQLGEQA
jgi:hypothetical protein